MVPHPYQNQPIMDGLYVNYSEASREGDLAVLKTCARKDVNKRDGDGMTPVHWAAAYGNLEALRILVGKGGNPDKPNNEGMTSLHLAASAGQLHCLVFLTNFGGNIYAISDSGTSAIQEAANKGRMECIRHLETFISHQVEQDRLKVEKLQEKAKRDAEKRVKEKSKLLKKLDRDYEKKSAKTRKYGGSFHGQNHLQPSSSYNGFHRDIQNEMEEYDRKKMTYSQLTGIPPGVSPNNFDMIDQGDDDLSSTDESFRRAEEEFLTRQSETSDDIFMERSPFSPNANNTDRLSEQTASTHVRSLKSGRSVAASLRSIPNSNGFLHNGFGLMSQPGPTVTLKNGKIVSVSQNGKIGINSNQLIGKPVVTETTLNNSVTLKSNQNDSKRKKTSEMQMGPLFTFLHSLQLDECRQTFISERIDLRACLLCDEEDLREIGLQLGPRKKIVDAIKHRNDKLQNIQDMNDSAV